MANRRRYPPQVEVESQRPSRIPIYRPDFISDVQNYPELQAPHPIGSAGQVPMYIIPTFDARPINAYDWTTMTGTNPNDTGFVLAAATTASIFFQNDLGRIAIVRDWDIDVRWVGPLDTPVSPIDPTTGNSLVQPSLSFFVDGVAQPRMSGIILSDIAFGHVFGDAYIIAGEGALIEMRLQANSAAFLFGQVIMSMHGNSLLSRGLNINYEPGTDFVLPVHDSGMPPGSPVSIYPNPNYTDDEGGQ